MADATAPETGFATFVKWQRKRSENRPEFATDAYLATTWATGSSQWKAAWADVEDWHPAIREQCAVLDQASDAIEKLTAERDIHVAALKRIALGQGITSQAHASVIADEALTAAKRTGMEPKP